MLFLLVSNLNKIKVNEYIIIETTYTYKTTKK